MDELKAIAESNIDIVIDFRNIIGVENTAELIRICGGTSYYIPQMSAVLRDMRDKEVCSEFEKGRTLREISRKYDISDVTVRRIIKSKLYDKNNIGKGNK